MSCMRMTECIELDVCIYVTKKDDCYVHKVDGREIQQAKLLERPNSQNFDGPDEYGWVSGSCRHRGQQGGEP